MISRKHLFMWGITGFLPTSYITIVLRRRGNFMDYLFSVHYRDWVEREEQHTKSGEEAWENRCNSILTPYLPCI
jgi:hypothetical protein